MARIYTDMVTIGDVSIYQVSASPSGVLSATRGSLAVRSTAGQNETWQNIDGATTWRQIGVGVGWIGASYYVATGNTLASPNGTISNPFLTVQNAIDAANTAGLTTVQIFVGPGDYSAQPISVPTGMSVALHGSGTYLPLSGNYYTNLGAITKVFGSDDLLTLTECAFASISITDGGGGYGNVVLLDCYTLGGVICDPAVTDYVNLSYSATRTYDDSIGMRIQSGVTMTGEVRLRFVEVVGTVKADYLVLEDDAQIQSNQIEVSGTLLDCSGGARIRGSGSAPSIEFTGGAGQVRMDPYARAVYISDSGTVTNGTHLSPVWAGMVDCIRIPLLGAGGAKTADAGTGIPINARVTETRVLVTTPFDGGALIAVGDSASVNRLMTTAQNTPGVAANYSNPSDVLWPATRVPRVTLTGVSTVGAATIFVFYTIPNP